MPRYYIGSLVAILALVVSAAPAQDDLNDLQERAIKAGVSRIKNSVVQINTLGGADRVVVGPRGTQVRKAMGPTTGVVVAADGWIISSAFNFVNQPKTILVAVPGQKKTVPAKIVATDYSRMVTLLKVDLKGLPVPPMTPKSEIKVGQWSVALGRTLDPNIANLPSVSIGIISAVDRIWGRAIQTDAKVSPVNYGGPAMDIRGRVQGILVPASPQGDDSTAGIEWYDSGIGFAIPMDDVKAVLPRLMKGENLKKGLLDFRLRNEADYFGTEPVVGLVPPNSNAAKAGIQVNDLIVEIEGKPVFRKAQMLHIIGPKYDGDSVALKVKRAGKVVDIAQLKLAATVVAFAHAFLGILPMRDDPELGVEIRFVYPKSPADRAGLKEGDRILKAGVGPRAIMALNGIKSGRDQLQDIINSVQPGASIKLAVLRKGGKKTDTITVKLDSLSETTVNLMPEALPETASFKRAREARVTIDPKTGKPIRPKPPVKKDDKKEEKKIDTGLIKRVDPTRQHNYWIFLHDDYDPNVAHSVVLWLHPPGKFKEDDVEAFKDAWEDFCRDNHLILVCPVTENRRGWQPGESDWVNGVVRDVVRQYSVDPLRVIVHGMGTGGQMAFHLGFQARDLYRGVATMGAVFTGQVRNNLVSQRLAFFITTGDKDPLAKSIADSKTKLADRKYPVVYRTIKNVAAQYYDLPTLKEVIRWIDSLDRL